MGPSVAGGGAGAGVGGEGRPDDAGLLLERLYRQQRSQLSQCACWTFCLSAYFVANTQPRRLRMHGGLCSVVHGSSWHPGANV